jgi:DNA-binding response OmpR family regulator
MANEPPSVLVVDDDPETRALYERLLTNADVDSVADGGAALDVTVRQGIDIVLLDRRLPGLSGDTVAAELRRRADPPMVAIVTGVEPDLDILRIACDAYLTKPVAGADLRAVVERLDRRADYDDRLAELASLAAKRATLESALACDSLAESGEYTALCDRLRTLRADLEGMLEEFDPVDFTTAFRHPDFDTESAPVDAAGN